jgi:hypothetical protein
MAGADQKQAGSDAIASGKAHKAPPRESGRRLKLAPGYPSRAPLCTNTARELFLRLR